MRSDGEETTTPATARLRKMLFANFGGIAALFAFFLVLEQVDRRKTEGDAELAQVSLVLVAEMSRVPFERVGIVERDGRGEWRGASLRLKSSLSRKDARWSLRKQLMMDGWRYLGARNDAWGGGAESYFCKRGRKLRLRFETDAKSGERILVSLFTRVDHPFQRICQ